LLQLIKRIRQSSRLITSLPPDLQRIARDSYASGLKSVFFFAACCALLAYFVRLPIPDKILEEHRPREHVRNDESSSPLPRLSEDNHSENGVIDDNSHKILNGIPAPRPRRLSTYESVDGVMDPESRSRPDSRGS